MNANGWDLLREDKHILMKHITAGSVDTTAVLNRETGEWECRICGVDMERP